MAFQLDSNVFSKQKSLSDYMAVNEARDLQRAQAERTMEASDMAIQAARQKQEMEMVGMGLAGATEQDYPARRAALLKQGVPEQFLPEQYNPALIDAIMTKTGYKAKPSLAEQLMQPLSMMMQPQMQPTQEAAPIQTGSITTQPVGNIDQYAVDSGVMPPTQQNMDDLTSWGASFEKNGQQVPVVPPSGQQMPPQLPAQIPDTPTLQTPIPAYQPKTVGAAFEADKAGAKAAAELPTEIAKAQALAEIEAKKPLNAKDAAKRKESFAKISTGVDKFARESEFLTDQIDKAIALLEKGTTGGFSSAVGGIVPMETDAGTLNELLNTIKANNVISTLQSVRESSPTGGAFGNQSDKEGELLKAAKGSLNPVQTQLTLENLKTMRNTLPQVLAEKRTLLQKSYPDLYQMPEQPAQQPAVSAQKTIKWDDYKQ